MSTSADAALGKPLQGWRLRLYTIIFEADTRAGRLFDQWLIAVILASVVAVVVDSVQGTADRYHLLFDVAGVAVHRGLYAGVPGAPGLCAPPVALRAELLWRD